jgi:hypothetical protein
MTVPLLEAEAANQIVMSTTLQYQLDLTAVLVELEASHAKEACHFNPRQK